MFDVGRNIDRFNNKDVCVEIVVVSGKDWSDAMCWPMSGQKLCRSGGGDRRKEARYKSWW